MEAPPISTILPFSRPSFIAGIPAHSSTPPETPAIASIMALSSTARNVQTCVEERNTAFSTGVRITILSVYSAGTSSISFGTRINSLSSPSITFLIPSSKSSIEKFGSYKFSTNAAEDSFDFDSSEVVVSVSIGVSELDWFCVF